MCSRGRKLACVIDNDFHSFPGQSCRANAAGRIAYNFPSITFIWIIKDGFFAPPSKDISISAVPMIHNGQSKIFATE